LIIDSSAVIAVLRKEDDHLRYRQAIAESRECRMSTATYLETAIIADRDQSPLLSREFDRVITAMEVELVPVSVEQAQIARAAYRDFGRGSGHPARLNMGDCFAYALAIERGEPLLYKGDDFSHTDVRSALG
jgi:ribonuclease VapC